MNWLGLIEKVLKKSPIFVIVPIVIFFSLLLFKWQLQLPFDALWFFIGGIVGLYVIDVVEELFQLNPSPFRTIVFSIILFVLTFYIITSTLEFFAKGISLSLLLSLCMHYVNDLRRQKSLRQWYMVISETPSPSINMLIGTVFVFAIVLLSFLFIVS